MYLDVADNSTWSWTQEITKRDVTILHFIHFPTYYTIHSLHIASMNFTKQSQIACSMENVLIFMEPWNFVTRCSATLPTW